MKKIFFVVSFFIYSYAFSQKAIIIGKDVMVYANPSFDKPLNKINETEFVTIISVTPKRYLLKGSTNEQCDSYPWVKVKTSSAKEVYIFGKYVYKLLNDGDKEVREQLEKWNNYPLVFDNKKYNLRIAKNYSIGASDEEGLTNCSEFYPIIFIEGNYTSAKLIFNKNKSFSKFPYFSLTNDDGVQESISKIKQNQKGCQISIEDVFQEGTGNYDILISKEKDGSLIGTATKLIRK